MRLYSRENNYVAQLLQKDVGDLQQDPKHLNSQSRFWITDDENKKLSWFFVRIV
jgi:hypothetical protein